jgi:hypothetical protein
VERLTVLLRPVDLMRARPENRARLARFLGISGGSSIWDILTAANAMPQPETTMQTIGDIELFQTTDNAELDTKNDQLSAAFDDMEYLAQDLAEAGLEECERLRAELVKQVALEERLRDDIRAHCARIEALESGKIAIKPPKKAVKRKPTSKLFDDGEK